MYYSCQKYTDLYIVFLHNVYRILMYQKSKTLNLKKIVYRFTHIRVGIALYLECLFLIKITMIFAKGPVLNLLNVIQGH